MSDAAKAFTGVLTTSIGALPVACPAWFPTSTATWAIGPSSQLVERSEARLGAPPGQSASDYPRGLASKGLCLACRAAFQCALCRYIETGMEGRMAQAGAMLSGLPLSLALTGIRRQRGMR